MTLISAEQLRNKLQSDHSPVIIDVREPWEFEEKNLGAINIPLNELPQKIEELDYCRDQEVIVHCQSGKRSNIAMKYLSKSGFGDVKSLEGGIEAVLKLEP